MTSPIKDNKLARVRACYICSENVDNPRQCLNTNCLEIFCSDCLKYFVEKNGVCPACNQLIDLKIFEESVNLAQDDSGEGKTCELPSLMHVKEETVSDSIVNVIEVKNVNEQKSPTEINEIKPEKETELGDEIVAKDAQKVPTEEEQTMGMKSQIMVEINYDDYIQLDVEEDANEQFLLTPQNDEQNANANEEKNVIEKDADVTTQIEEKQFAIQEKDDEQINKTSLPNDHNYEKENEIKNSENVCEEMETEEEKASEPPSEEEKPKIDLCKIHGHPLILYCTEDEICVCIECVMSSEHVLHNFRTIETVYEDKMEKIREKFSDVASYWAGLKQIAGRIEDNLNCMDNAENRLFEKIKKELQEERPKAAFALKQARYQELIGKRSEVVGVSNMVKNTVVNLTSNLKDLTKPQLIARKEDMIKSASSVIEKPLTDFEHQRISCDFYTEFVSQFQKGYKMDLEFSVLQQQPLSMIFHDSWGTNWEFQFFINGGFLTYNVIRNINITTTYDFVIEIRHETLNKMIKHEGVLNVDNKEKFSNLQIIDTEFLISNGYINEEAFKVIIRVRPRNVFEKTPLNKKLLTEKNIVIQQMQSEIDDIKKQIKELSPVPKKASKRNMEENRRSNTLT